MIKRWVEFTNEDFTEDTLSANNNIYNTYYDRNKDSKQDRRKVVAWEVPRSQFTNFSMVSRFIKSGDSLLDYGCGIGDFITHLKGRGVKVSDYLGVDINPNFIRMAKESYPDNNFQLINKIEDVNGNWDVICAIGVFSWSIKKDEFVKTINRLYELCNKYVLITCNFGFTNWETKYIKYDYDTFESLFPDFKFDFDLSGDMTLSVKINKKM